jgi:hypothetical protein
MAEDRQRAGAGAVVLFRAVGKDAFKQVAILIHGVASGLFAKAKYQGELLRRIYPPGRPIDRSDSASGGNYTLKMTIRPRNDKGGTRGPALDP